MIRALPAALLLASCQSMTQPCPAPMITAVICPVPMSDFYDSEFRDELNNELQLAPEDLALSKAARSYLEWAKKCERTL